MSRTNPSNSPRFQIDRALVRSPAFRALKTPNAVRVLLDFHSKRRWVEKTNGRKRKKQWAFVNNGELEYTYKEAERRGMSSSVFVRALDELIAHGFIDVVETGAGVHKMKTLYSLSDRWQKWGTEEYVINKRPKKKRFRENRGFQRGHPYHPPKSRT